MRDAYGGIVNITFIVVFIVIISGYLAFSVNYNKAFRVKNKIINSIEVCEGIDQSKGDSGCAQKYINEYMHDVGYNLAGDFTMDSSWTCPPGKGYCYKENEINPDEDNSEFGQKKVYYTVVTAVSIDLPIVNRILPRILQVSGNTKTITIH